MAGGVSSQYFSALLMVAPCTRRGIAIDVEGDLVSKPYIDVTAQAMSAFGATFLREGYERFEVPAGAYRATAYDVEPDASAASYFFAAAAITRGRVIVPGLGARSLQGDLGFVRLLERMAGESAVLCTHGDVSTEVLVALHPDGGSDPGPATRLQKGEVWVIQSTGTRLDIVDHLRPVKVGGR